MTMSCNGCKILRKGCDDNCILRPCLSWITSPESQANATLFLAKFYGRAGLLNLIDAGPNHLRADIFKSLLHEACGRIINPTYGSVGLIWSGNWEHCQAVVDSVLQGSTIMQLPNHDNVAPQNSIMPLEGCDIRHLSKNPNNEQHRAQIRKMFKRPRGVLQAGSSSSSAEELVKCNIIGGKWEEMMVNQALSHESVCVENNDKHGNDDDESGKVLLELTLG